jgi:class 3 adenylate cyclase
VIRGSETQYARAPDGAYIAYQVIGSGELDIVYHPGAATHAELIWDFPMLVRWPLRLAAMGRVITFDVRGTGGSDPLPSDRAFTLDESVADVLAVLDAAEAERVALIGQTFSGPVFCRIAAQHPHRVEALALSGTAARFVRASDYEHGMPPESLERALAILEAGWADGSMIDLWLPSMADRPLQRQEFARYCRGCCSPGRAALLARTWWGFDASADLPNIAVRTLVEHSTDDAMVPIALGRYLAEHIQGARFIERGGDRLAVGAAVDEAATDYSQFLLGKGAVVPGGDRRVATVVFLDIVESTATASHFGDRSWRDLLDEFRRSVRAELERFGGREINTRGDDFLLLFDGPRAAIGCVRAVRERAAVLDLELRVGAHLGEVEDLGDDVTGLSVHLGARIASLARPGEILASQTLRDAVIGSDLSFEGRGVHELKGIPDQWRLYAVG